MKNKKGSTQVWGFVLMFAALFVAIWLGIAVYLFGTVNDVLSIDVDIGQVNLKTISDATYGQMNTGLINNADTIGIIMLFGMSLLMILNGFVTGSRYPRLFFVVDIFLLVLFFIPAIYISQLYETFINSTPLFENAFMNVIPKVSKFMLNLPTIIGTVGVLTMILTYSGLNRREETGGVNVGNF